MLWVIDYFCSDYIKRILYQVVKRAIPLFVASVFFWAACKKKDIYVPSDENLILAFVIEKEKNPEIAVDIVAKINGDSIVLQIPEGWPTTFTPTVQVSEKASLKHFPGETDFSKPANFTVIAESGSERTYSTVIQPVSEPALTRLVINGALCPFDSASNTYYYPVTPGKNFSSFQVAFDSIPFMKVSLAGKEVENGQNTDLVFKTNDIIEISAFNDFQQQKTYKLLITGLPLVQLRGNPEIGEEYMPIYFSLIDPAYEQRSGAYYVTSDATIKIRGGTSRAYPKKNFAIKTKDENGINKDIPLLGLRNDQSWILDAMYIDKAKMRNRVCTDIWNSMNNVPHIDLEPDALNGTRGYLTEVFINNEYRGVYMLTEKVDRKQVKAKKKRGFVYKGKSWTDAVLFIGSIPYDNTSEEWDGWEIKYPDAGDDRPIDWRPLFDVVEFVSTSTEEEFKAGIGNHVNTDNIIDYFIFTNAVQAEDNAAKNTYFSLYDTSLSKQFFYSVWDLDATLGRGWNGQIQIDYFYFWGMNNRILRKLMNMNPDNFRARFKARWNVLKNNQLSPDAVTERILHYKEQLSATGAERREASKWPGTIESLDTETDYMIRRYLQHWRELDEYINGL